MKIYTKTGDGGETGLFGGRRVGKDDLRVLAYGEVDELNAHLGWAVSLLPDSSLGEDILAIQADLFRVGADLATPPDAGAAAQSRTVRVDDESILRLEGLIDDLAADTPELRHFILPGGAPGAAALHVARTVCRRAERAVVALSRMEEVSLAALIYLNRLSDLLFVMARFENHRSGTEEPTWRGSDGSPSDPA